MNVDAFGIALAAETETHYLFFRDNCLALVERRSNTIGSTGMMTELGIAYLVWRDGQAFLKSKATETPATGEQVAEVQRFSHDLAAALR